MARRNKRNSRDKQAHTPIRSLNIPRREFKRGSEWFVRDIKSSASQKIYKCPGCPNDILEGQAHIVAWQADHFFGDEFSIDDRRHWHTHCWRLS